MSKICLSLVHQYTNQTLKMKHQFEYTHPVYGSFLLPAGFRKLGYGIIIIALIITMLLGIISANRMPAGEQNKGVSMVTLSSVLLIIALVCISWARDRQEDEFTGLLKLKALRNSFVAGIGYFLVMAILFLNGGSNALPSAGIEPLLGILALYHLSYYLLKYRAS